MHSRFLPVLVLDETFQALHLLRRQIVFVHDPRKRDALGINVPRLTREPVSPSEGDERRKKKQAARQNLPEAQSTQDHMSGALI